jgi:hypothetical protein
MSTDPHLNFAKIKHLAIRDRILADNPGIDDQTLADTVEGLSELPDKLAAILRDALFTEAMALGLQELMKDHAARLKRLKDRAERLRALVRDEMIDADISKLQMPDFTASTRKGPVHLVVTDEERIPPDFFQLFKQLDKNAVTAALKNGAHVPGAEMSNPGTTLSVRTR